MKVFLLRTILFGLGFLILLTGCLSTRITKEFDSSEMAGLIEKLKEDEHLHEQIGPKMNAKEIARVEKTIGLRLPNSYRYYLMEFGNGAYWLYNNSMDDINNFSFLNKYRKRLGDSISLDGKNYATNSLLNLMTEDHNGGAWVWLTGENTDTGEWPLAYYSLDGKLHFKVDNFTEWIRFATRCKCEVIRALDKEHSLNLGI